MKKIWMLIFVLTMVLSSAWGDVIYLSNMEQRSNIKVVRDRASEVEYKDENGKFHKLSSEQVLLVEFSEGPQEYLQGIQAFRNQNYLKAISFLEKVKKPQFQPYANFYIAESHRKTGDFRKAVLGYKYFNTQDLRVTPMALFSLGRIYLNQRDFSSAKMVFDNLTNANFNKYWKYKARYGIGMAYLYQKNYGSAQSEFVAVENASASEKDASFGTLRQLAIQGWGLSLVGQKTYDKAMLKFQEVIKLSNHEEVLCGAYLGMGRMYYSMAKDGKDSKNNYKRALFSYLRVATLYSTLKLEYAEALHFAASCYSQLGQDKNAGYLKEEIQIRVPSWARYSGSE